jgi:hypothetical protein
MAEINNRFKVKKGLDVLGDTTLTGNVVVTGYVTVPTQISTDNSTKVANTAFVTTAINNLIAAAPGALDTLDELALALGDDPNFATTMTNTLALKAPLASPDLTGTPTTPTATPGTNTTQIASTAFVAALGALKANLASPALTGTPTAPTAAVGTNTTQLATTAFVVAQAANVAPLMDSVATTGTSTRYARQDHIHASDVTKANLSGAAFTGNITIIHPTLPSTLTIGSAAVAGPHMYDVIGGGTNVDFGYKLENKLAVWSNTGSPNITRLGANNVEKMRLTDTGVLINTTSDNGVDALQVNGSVSATTFKGSAALTGSPTAPTAAPATNNTQIATTAFTTIAVAHGKVDTALSGKTTLSGSLITSDFRMLPIPAAARYLTTSIVNITGAIKIVLPILYDSASLSFKLTVQESGKSFDMTIGGTMYNSTSTWGQCYAIQYGEVGSKTPSVRFGNDGTNSVIWIGEVDDVWNTPQVFINDVKLGYAMVNSAWSNNWAVSFVAIFDTVKATATPVKLAALASPALSGVPTAPTAAAGTNTTQLATTAFVTTADNLKANLASPALTGTPTAPTAAAGTNTTQIATTAFVGAAITNLIASAPGALDTLDELAAALGDDANFAATVTTNLALKAPLASPVLTGTPTAPTAAVDTNTTQLATTAYVVGQAYLKTATAASTYAPLASPALTGTPTAPTAATTVNSTQIATTAFVHSAIDALLTKAITGNVTLSATEALSRILVFTGVLASNATVTIPTASARYIVDNRTTGAYTLTIKMATGTGVNVAQGYRAEVYCDAANVFMSRTDYTDAFIGGTPTTTTAAAADNTTRIASTAHVKAAIAASNTVKNDSTNSADPFGLVTFAESLTLTTSWQDTSISGTDLATGSYMVQVYADDNTVGGQHYTEYYSGVMSWYSGGTNSTDSDEILLHRAGRAPNNGYIYLRTLRTDSAPATLKLQISGDLNTSGPSTYTIKFRRLI